MHSAWLATFLACLLSFGSLSARADLSVPSWKDDPIDLGLFNEGTPVQVPLKDFVRADAGDTLTFRANQLPKWLALDGTTGVVSGTPARKDVGDYKGIEFIVAGKTGNATVSARVTVKKVPKTAAWGAKEFTLPDAAEDGPYSVSLADAKYLSMEDAEAMTFTAGNGMPAWMSLGPNGLLYGQPQRKDVGAVALTVIVQSKNPDGVALTSAAVFRFNVKATNHAPTWKQPLIALPDAYTLKPYSQTLAGAATDPDAGDTLTFSLTQGPSWLKVAADGTLSGTPARSDAGTARLTVKVADQAGASASAQLQLNTLRSNEPPTWQKPLQLPNAKEGVPYRVDLSQFANDPDGDRLYFTRVDDGNAWLKVSDNGAAIGTPTRGDVGPLKLKFKVEDRISGADIVETAIFVDKAPSVPVWKLDPVVITATEDQPLAVDLSPYATDLDYPTKLTFAKGGGADWLTVSAQGALVGKPAAAQVGDNALTVKVANPTGASVVGSVIVRVTHVNHAPKWSYAAIDLPNATEGVAYTTTLKDKATDPDKGDVLIYEKASAEPRWLTVDADGTLHGTPWKTDIGTVEFSIRVHDQAQASDVTTAKITVQKAVKGPRWRANPVPLDALYAGATATFDLTPYVTSDDGSKVTFTMTEGPRWLSVSPEGTITAQPGIADAGPVRAVFRATAGTLTADANATGTVNARNLAPLILAKTIAFKVRVGEKLTANLNTPDYVVDPQGGSLSFRLVTASNFANVTLDGQFQALPQAGQTGTYPLQFEVTNSSGAVTGQLTLEVLAASAPPKWTQTPVPLTGTVGTPFTGKLAGFVTSDQPVTFARADTTKVWFSLAADGTLGGTPQYTDVGTNGYQINACTADKQCATGVLQLTVTKAVINQSYSLATVTPGARNEWLWLIDHEEADAPLIATLKTEAATMHQALNTAKVAFRGVVVSAETKVADGAPIAGDGNYRFYGSNSQNIARDFGVRLDLAYAQGCVGCLMSPIWSMVRFTQRLKEFADFYPAYFLAGGLPLEIVMVSPHVDQFATYAKSDPNFAGKDVTAYSQYLASFVAAKKGVARVHAIAPQCPNLLPEDDGGTEADNAYQTLVAATGGKAYGDKCTIDVKGALADISALATTRARLFALSRIQLTAYPDDPDGVALRLAGQAIDHQTTTGDPIWSYDAATNSVSIRWDRALPATLAPDAKVEVQYTKNPAQEMARAKRASSNVRAGIAKG